MTRVGSPRTRTPRRSAWPVALALAFVLGNLFNAALLAPLGHSGAATSGQALAAPLPDGGGQALVGQPVTPRRVALHPSATPPTPTAQQRQATPDRLRQYKKPVGPIHQLTAAETAALARTAGPPLPHPTPQNTLHLNPTTTPKTTPGGPQADSDFDVEQFTPIGSWGVCPACSLATVGPNMSVANDGNTYWAVGNFFAAIYTASGSLMSWYNPYAVAGAVGESFSDGNQQVLYEPSRAVFLWVLQSAAPNYHLVLFNISGNCIYDFTPTSFGLPSGDHLLSPDLEYSSNYLYLSFVLLDSSYNFADVGVARISLSLLQACGTLTPSAVVRSDNASFTLGQGATDTMYWLSNDYLSGPTNGNHVRVFFWAESSGSYTYLDEKIDPFTFLTYGTGNCASQDGAVINWCSNLDSTAATLYRSRSGYRGFGAPMLGMAWPAGPTTGISPFPYVVREYFLLANMAYKGHDNVYNANFAVAWPSLASPTTRGYVGGAFAYGGGTNNAGDVYPGNFYLIEDPDTPTQPWSMHFVPGNGNTNMFTNSWGYTMARAWNPDELHWVAAGWLINVSTAYPYVVVFGRGRDHSAYLRWAMS